MARFMLLLSTLFLLIADANSISGQWIFDLNRSIKAKEIFASYYKQLDGMVITIDANRSYAILGRESGSWKEHGDAFLLTSKKGKKMGAKLLKENQLLLFRGRVPLFFRKVANGKDISEYIYLDRVYKQRAKVYENGYLYYLFLNNGVFYSYVSNKESVTAEEIKRAGDRLEYQFLGDKIVMKGPYKIVIIAYGKEKIVTSQGDILYLEKKR